MTVLLCGPRAEPMLLRRRGAAWGPLLPSAGARAAATARRRPVTTGRMPFAYGRARGIHPARHPRGAHPPRLAIAEGLAPRPGRPDDVDAIVALETAAEPVDDTGQHDSAEDLTAW